jgi:hypothetical protein
MSIKLNVDPLVYWIVERESIRRKQAAGEPRPWTDDELLATYRFCSPNVSHDRVSRAIFETFTRPYADHPGLIVALAVCRFTNALEVFEAVRDCLVPFDPQRFVAVMADRAARGLSKERRAYMIPGGIEGELKAASLTRDLFTPLANAVEQIRPQPGDRCAAVFERLRSFQYLNEGFITAQIVRDLKQVEPLRSASDSRTFVWPGPGSQRGVNRLLGAVTAAEIDRIRPEAEWRALFWDIVNAAAPRVAEQGVEIEDAQSWQNTLCECDKAIRYRSGDFRGARKYKPYGETPAKKTRAPRTARPVEVPLPEPPAPVVPAPHALLELTTQRDSNVGHTLFRDFETRSTLDLKACGVARYAADPTTEVMVAAYAADGEPTQIWVPGDPIPAEFAEAAGNPNWLVCAHNAAHHVVTAAETALQAEFCEITELKSTNQVDKFVTWLAEHGCIVSDLQKNTLAHALRRKGLAPEVHRALELRLELAHASAGKVGALRTWRGPDGRVRGTLKYHGAGPGRWTGHGPQPQNFRRDGGDIDAKITAVMNGGNGLSSPIEAVGDIARAMITAAPGHRLLIADFSGIESRVLAWITGQQSKVQAWAQFDRTGRAEDDPYVRIARRCGLTGEGARDVGKIVDLAFGFGGSVGAWQRLALEDDTTDEATVRRYRDTWRTEHPQTVKFWYALDRAAIAAVRRPGTAFPVGRVSYRYDAPFLRLTLPSGRAIFVSVRANCWNRQVWAPATDISGQRRRQVCRLPLRSRCLVWDVDRERRASGRSRSARGRDAATRGRHLSGRAPRPRRSRLRGA